MASGRKGNGRVAAKAPDQTSTHAAALVELRRLERLFEDCEWPQRRVFVGARKRASERALEALDAAGSGPGATRTALLVDAAELLGALRVELAACPQDAARLVERIEDVTGLSRITLARELLRAPELLTLSPAVAVEAQLGMLVALAPLRSASLWTLDDAEQVSCA